MLKLAIVGSRQISEMGVLTDALSRVKNLSWFDTIVSGGAEGVDTLARQFSEERGLKLIEFLPDYKQFGKKAPLVRNTDIVKTADVVLAIPLRGGSKGTWDSINKAVKLGKKVYVFEVFPSSKMGIMTEM